MKEAVNIGGDFKRHRRADPSQPGIPQ